MKKKNANPHQVDAVVRFFKFLHLFSQLKNVLCFQGLLTILAGFWYLVSFGHRGRWGYRTYRCLSVGVFYNLISLQSQKEALSIYGPNFLSSGVFDAVNHNTHATILQLWNTLQKPHLLSLMIPPKHSVVDKIFYTP